MLTVTSKQNIQISFRRWVEKITFAANAYVWIICSDCHVIMNMHPCAVYVKSEKSWIFIFLHSFVICGRGFLWDTSRTVIQIWFRVFVCYSSSLAWNTDCVQSLCQQMFELCENATFQPANDLHESLGSSEVFIACKSSQRETVFSFRAIKEMHIALKSTTVATYLKNIACNWCISPQLIFGLNNKRFVFQRALFGTITMSYWVGSRER